MKRLIEILFLLVPFILTAQTVTETQYGAGVEYYMYISSADSGDVDFNFPGSINDFDDDLTSNPIAYQVKLDTLGNDATETEIIGIYIQGYYIDAWSNIDTVVAADTLNASHTWASATFYGKGLLDFGETITKYSRYRVRIVATNALGQPYAAYMKFYAYKRD